MDTGWTVDHVLKMKATRFFAMRKALIEIRQEREGFFYHEMIHVGLAANNPGDGAKEMQAHYKSWFAPPETKRRQQMGRTFDLGDDKDFDQVRNIFTSVRKYMR